MAEKKQHYSEKENKYWRIINHLCINLWIRQLSRVQQYDLFQNPHQRIPTIPCKGRRGSQRWNKRKYTPQLSPWPALPLSCWYLPTTTRWNNVEEGWEGYIKRKGAGGCKMAVSSLTRVYYAQPCAFVSFTLSHTPKFSFKFLKINNK